MVENLRWIREEGRKHYQGWLINPCHARCGGRKKWLLLAKECFDLLETIATRKTIFEQCISCKVQAGRRAGRYFPARAGKKTGGISASFSKSIAFVPGVAISQPVLTLALSLTSLAWGSQCMGQKPDLLTIVCLSPSLQMEKERPE